MTKSNGTKAVRAFTENLRNGKDNIADRVVRNFHYGLRSLVRPIAIFKHGVDVVAAGANAGVIIMTDATLKPMAHKLVADTVDNLAARINQCVDIAEKSLKHPTASVEISKIETAVSQMIVLSEQESRFEKHEKAIRETLERIEAVCSEFEVSATINFLPGVSDSMLNVVDRDGNYATVVDKHGNVNDSVLTAEQTISAILEEVKTYADRHGIDIVEVLGESEMTFKHDTVDEGDGDEVSEDSQDSEENPTMVERAARRACVVRWQDLVIRLSHLNKKLQAEIKKQKEAEGDDDGEDGETGLKKIPWYVSKLSPSKFKIRISLYDVSVTNGLLDVAEDDEEDGGDKTVQSIVENIKKVCDALEVSPNKAVDPKWLVKIEEKEASWLEIEVA